MNLLIIGGTGVLSSAVVNEALRQNLSVTIVNRGRKKKTIPQGVELIEADYHDKSLMEKRMSGRHYDVVIDFIVFKKEEITYSVDLFHKIADQYVFISTTCVYNTEIAGIKTEESDKVLKAWNYSANKWDCEQYLCSEAQRLSLKYTIIRPCITYDDTRIPYGIMPQYGYHWTFIARILNGKPVLRWDGGNAKWNMMRVEDFAVGVVGLLGNPQAYGEAFNLSGDNAYSWNDVLSALHKTLGVRPIPFDITAEEYAKSYPMKKGEIIGRSLDSIVDNSKIKSAVPYYKTSYSLNEGVAKTVNAYRTQNYQRGIDWNFDADTDRIIKKWCKKNKTDSSQYKIGFVDYLGNATLIDKIQYYFSYHKERCDIRLVQFAIRICRRIKKEFTKRKRCMFCK